METDVGVVGAWLLVIHTMSAIADVNSLHSSIAGGTAGVVSRIVSAPLDVLKIRFQLQVEPIKRVRIIIYVH